MNAVVVASQLASTPAAVRAQLTGLPDDIARWKPAPTKWSLLEVLCHMADEERQDFRLRLRLVLESSEAPWPDIDPATWPAQRGYNTREVNASLIDFERERAESLKWLGGLRHVRWDAIHHHPKLGSLAAGDILAAWVAHDLLHMRQMINLRLAALEAGATPYSTRYATA
jgi:hypothetical protein